MKRYTPWSVLMLLLLSVTLAGCEGESPTIPTTTQPPGGPAPSGQAEVVLTASNPNPLVNSTTTITATVTIGGQPAPAGTAIEFSTNLGAFTESNSQTALRITGANGTATVTLTSTIAGPAIVGARVANVFRTITVTFRVETTPPPPTDASPAITSISPTTGIPAGGQLVTIVGKNFTQPLRVLFGDRVATVVSATDTQIQVATPAINLGTAEQRRAVDVRVITQAGTPEEKSATSPTQFTYELAVLTPGLTHVAPSSGPNEGNTRITIFGDGFQAPMRAFFGTGGSAGGALTDQVELEVLQVFFDRIIAMTPPALGLGTSLRDQQVTLRVLNTLSNLDAVLPLAFRYGPEMQITAVEPLSGTALGGTKVTINGWGFDDPVLVTIAGVRAQPVSADGTRIVVVTSALLSPCTSVEGNILVTNVEDGAFDQYGDGTNETGFSYIGTQPSIISVGPNPALPGQAVAIGVRNAGAGTIRFQIGTSTLLPTPPAATNPQGESIFNVTIPTNISFSTEACTDALGRAGTRFVPLVQSIVFNNITTGCTDTLNGGLTINPTDTSCRVPPDAVLNPQTATFTGTCGGPSQVVTISVSNVGGSNLDVSGIVSSLANFQVVAGTFPTTVAPGAPPASFQVQINPLPAALPGPPITAPPATQGTINVATNDPTPPPAIQGTVTCTP